MKATLREAAKGRKTEASSSEMPVLAMASASTRKPVTKEKSCDEVTRGDEVTKEKSCSRGELRRDQARVGELMRDRELRRAHERAFEIGAAHERSCSHLPRHVAQDIERVAHAHREVEDEGADAHAQDDKVDWQRVERSGRDRQGSGGIGRDRKGWEGIGRNGKGWEGMGRDRKGSEGIGRDQEDSGRTPGSPCTDSRAQMSVAVSTRT